VVCAPQTTVKFERNIMRIIK